MKNKSLVMKTLVLCIATMGSFANASDEVKFYSQPVQSVNTFLKENIDGVAVVDHAGSDYLSNVIIRGYSLGTEEGTPQGVAVLQDGVRLLNRLGDNTDLAQLPLIAMKSVSLGTDRLSMVGTGALGGVLSFKTKDGFDFRGPVRGSVLAGFGSHGSHMLGAEAGGSQGDLAWYIAASKTDNDNFRRSVADESKNFFAKLSYRDADRFGNITLSHASADAFNAGLTPSRLPERSVFVAGLGRESSSNLFMVDGGIALTEDAKVGAAVFLRNSKYSTLGYAFDDSFVAPGDYENSVNRFEFDQNSFGGNIFLERSFEKNDFKIGAEFESSNLSAKRFTQEGIFLGNQLLPIEASIQDLNLKGNYRTWGLFVQNTYRFNDSLTFDAGLRMNKTNIKIRDLDDPTSGLNGEHSYSNTNPYIGAQYAFTPSIQAFGSVERNSRLPTMIELSCADPNEPCKLPNSMESDPPLKQVRVTTYEAGVRGSHGLFNWSASAFKAVSNDDILFVASSAPGLGYFLNAGDTERQGVKLAASSYLTDNLKVSGGYVWTDARYGSDECFVSAKNSTAGLGSCGPDAIQVSKNDKLPGIPEHTFRARVDYNIQPTVTVGATLNAYSGVYVRGNENNKHDQDGKTSGFATLNLHVDARLVSGINIFARINNVFDKSYSTGGQLGFNPFANGAYQDPSNWTADTFASVGAPRTFFVGASYGF